MTSRAQARGASAGREAGDEGATELVRVRVWDLPVRVIHWLLVADILLLSVTGLYIAQPFVSVVDEPGYQLMVLVKAVHYGGGITFATLVVARVAWAFVGTHWARWHQFVPVHRERQALVPHSLAYYLFLRRDPPPVAGHNPLAGMTYLVLFLMFALEIVTGFALRGLEERDGLLWNTFSVWVFDLASVQAVRFVHHLVLWLTVGFVVHHVYSAVLIDHEERSGLVSSIITGTKTLPRALARRRGQR